jgi:hypothetical protein
VRLCGNDVNVTGRLVRIAQLDSNSYESLDDPYAMLDILRRSGTRVDLFTFEQTMPHTSPKHPFYFEWNNFAVLPISSFDKWWKEQIGGKVRNMVKKAEKKGVTVREVPFDNDLVQGIWQIYNECPVRQGRRFPHYGEDIETVRRISATFVDTSIFIGAFLGDRLIGFTKLTMDQKREQASVMHILSFIEQRDKAPTNALIAQAVRSCAERQIPHLVYSRFSYGKKLRDGLSDFKESNGFGVVQVPQYYVPLNRFGSLALRFGLHHRLRERIPESVVANLRKFRDSLYSQTLQPVEETTRSLPRP